MSEKKRTRTKMLIGIIILLILIIIILLGLKACAPVKDGNEKVTGNATERFYGTTKKHGIVEFSSKQADSEYGEVQKFEYWFDGEKFRITWYQEDGSVRLHMISPDGEKMYHCNPEKETSVISYTGPEFLHWIFNGPKGYKIGDGIQEGAFKVYTYKTQKLWEIDGASQKFYCEDVTLYTKDDELVKIVTRTNSKKVEEDELVSSQYLIKEQSNNVKFDKDLFELPYKIVTP